MTEDWIDRLPDSGIRGLPRFLIELGPVMPDSDAVRIWAQSQWVKESDPRQVARDLVPFAELSEKGRALVAAWKSTVGAS